MSSKDFNRNSDGCDKITFYFIFLQLIWKSTKYVGCIAGYRFIREEENFLVLVVCLYSPRAEPTQGYIVEQNVPRTSLT